MRLSTYLREQRVEHLLGAGLELVERQHVGVLGLLLALDDLQRQQPDVGRLLDQHRAEPRVDDVDLVDAVLLVVDERSMRASPISLATS